MFVLTPDLGLGDATAKSAARPTWPANPEPIAGSHPVVNAPRLAPRLGLCGHRCRRRYRSLRDRARTHRRTAPPTHRTARSLTTH